MGVQTSHPSFTLLSDKPQELRQGDLYTTEALPFSGACMRESATCAEKSAEAAQNLKPRKRKTRRAAACFNSNVSPGGLRSVQSNSSIIIIPQH